MSTENWSPVDIERKIFEVSNLIAKSVPVCGERYAAFLKADHEYDIAYARAWANCEGTVKDRECQVELAVVEERANRDVADAAYRYSDRKARALQEELKALQSIGVSIRTAYAVVGRGDSAA